MAEDMTFPNTPGMVMLPVVRSVQKPDGGAALEIVRWYPALQETMRTGVFIGHGESYVQDIQEAADFRGASGTTRVVTEEQVMIQPGEPGAPGPAGPSAYDVSVANGFSGSEAQWLASLRGLDGSNGRDGAAGRDGKDGEPGLPGTPGTPGRDGANGKDGKDGRDGRDAGVVLGEIDITEQAVLAIALGIRTRDVEVPASFGLRQADGILVLPTAPLPAGYVLHCAAPLSASQIRIYFTGPALALGTSRTFRIRIIAVGRT